MSLVSWRGPKRQRGPEAELSFDHSAKALSVDQNLFRAKSRFLGREVLVRQLTYVRSVGGEHLQPRAETRGLRTAIFCPNRMPVGKA